MRLCSRVYVYANDTANAVSERSRCLTRLRYFDLLSRILFSRYRSASSAQEITHEYKVTGRKVASEISTSVLTRLLTLLVRERNFLPMSKHEIFHSRAHMSMARGRSGGGGQHNARIERPLYIREEGAESCLSIFTKTCPKAEEPRPQQQINQNLPRGSSKCSKAVFGKSFASRLYIPRAAS